jgi:hypothetical protein
MKCYVWFGGVEWRRTLESRGTVSPIPSLTEEEANNNTNATLINNYLLLLLLPLLTS